MNTGGGDGTRTVALAYRHSVADHSARLAVRRTGLNEPIFYNAKSGGLTAAVLLGALWHAFSYRIRDPSPGAILVITPH
jgi:hypothetical protein